MQCSVLLPCIGVAILVGRARAPRMQYYTRQQLQGAGRYHSACRIGNWNEDLALEEVRRRCMTRVWRGLNEENKGMYKDNGLCVRVFFPFFSLVVRSFIHCPWTWPSCRVSWKSTSVKENVASCSLTSISAESMLLWLQLASKLPTVKRSHLEMLLFSSIRIQVLKSSRSTPRPFTRYRPSNFHK